MKKFFNNIEECVGAVLLAVMTLITVTNVFCRYVLHASISASEEITTLLFVLLSLLGSAVAVKRKAHLGLTILTDRLSPKAQKYITVFGYLCGVLFCAILVYEGIFMVKNEYDYKVLTISMNWPEWIFGMFVPIGGTFIGIRFIQMIYKELKGTKELSGKDGE